MILPKTIGASRRVLFEQSRRALFDACADTFAEGLANGLTPTAAARRAGLPKGLAPALLVYLHDQIWAPGNA